VSTDYSDFSKRKENEREEKKENERIRIPFRDAGNPPGVSKM